MYLPQDVTQKFLTYFVLAQNFTFVDMYCLIGLDKIHILTF